MYSLVYSRKGSVLKTYQIEPDESEVKTVGRVDTCSYALDYDAEIEAIHLMLRFVKDHFEICAVVPCKIDDCSLTLNEWTPLPFDQLCYLSEYSAIEIKGGKNPPGLAPRSSPPKKKAGQRVAPETAATELPPVAEIPELSAPPSKKPEMSSPARKEKSDDRRSTGKTAKKIEAEEPVLESETEDDSEIADILQKIVKEEIPSESAQAPKALPASQGEGEVEQDKLEELLAEMEVKEDKELTAILQKIERQADGAPTPPRPQSPETVSPTIVEPIAHQVPPDAKITNRYQILRKIGAGAMGTVYEAHDNRLQRKVALKILMIEDPNSVAAQRFYREAKAIGKLSHANIVALHDVGEYQGHPFFTMDLLVGKDLQQLTAEGNVAPRQAMSWAFNIANALQFAHQHDVIHRDIKPSNIIVTAQGAVLTDFGIAKDTSVQSQLTTAGETLGTPTYMSPEQARGQLESIDFTSDVYSLGAVLYELLTRHPPFKGTPVEVLHKVCTMEPQSVRHLNPDVHQDAVTITMKALSKEQRYRYRTAGEMAEDIERYLDGEPILGKLPPVHVRLLAMAKTYRKFSLCLVLLLLVLSVVVGSQIYRQHRDRVRQHEDAMQVLAKARAAHAEMAKTKIAIEEMLDIMDTYTRVLTQDPGNVQAIEGKYQVMLEIAGRLENEGKLEFADALYQTARSIAEESRQKYNIFTEKDTADLDAKSSGIKAAKAMLKKEALTNAREIVENLTRENASQEDVAEAALCMLKFPEAFIEIKLDYLSHDDFRVRKMIALADGYFEKDGSGETNDMNEIMARLVPYSNDTVNETLVEGLGSPLPRVRLFCAKMLGLNKYPPAIPALLTRLKSEPFAGDLPEEDPLRRISAACIRSLMAIEGGEESLFQEILLPDTGERDYLFVLQKKEIEYIYEDRGLPEYVREKFNTNGHSLSYKLGLQRRKGDEKWAITDKERDKKYVLIEGEDTVYVCYAEIKERLDARKNVLTGFLGGGKTALPMAVKILSDNLQNTARYASSQKFPLFYRYLAQERSDLRDYFIRIGKDSVALLKDRLREAVRGEKIFIIRLLPELAPPEALPVVMEYGSSSDQEVKKAAYSVMGDLVDILYGRAGDDGREQARQRLVTIATDGLDSQDMEIQAYAVATLGKLRDEASAPRILEALDSSFRNESPQETQSAELKLFRQNSVEALGMLGPGITDLLLRKLQDAQGNRKFALLGALARANSREALPRIVNSLTSDDQQEYKNAVAILKYLGEESVKDLKILFAKENSATRCDILEATSKIPGEEIYDLYDQALADPDEKVARAAVAALAQRGAKALPYLLKALMYKKDGDKITLAAKEALQHLGDSATSAMVDILSRPAPLAARYNLPPDAVRKRAVEVLVAVGRPAISHVVPLLESLDLRIYALEIIAKTGNREDVHYLIEYMFEKDLGKTVRQYLVEYMKNAAVPELIKMWKESKEGKYTEEKKGMILEILAGIGHQEALPIFLETLADRIYQEQTRLAMENMGNLAVQELLKSLDNDALREGAADALAGIPNVAFQPLVETLKNPNTDDRLKSQIPRIMIRMRREQQVISTLLEIVANDKTSPGIHAAIWDAIGDAKNPVPHVVGFLEKTGALNAGAQSVLSREEHRKEAVAELVRVWRENVLKDTSRSNIADALISPIVQVDENARALWIGKLLSYFSNKSLRPHILARLGTVHWATVKPTVRRDAAQTLKAYLNDKDLTVKNQIAGLLGAIDPEKKWH